MNSRRKFIQSLALAPMIGAGCATAQRQPAFAGRPPRNAPRKIIHLVADGMSAGTLSCAHQFSEINRGRGLTWFTLANTPGSHIGFMDMRSQNSIVTDSSAASSVWGSGVRIPNGKVNQTSKGEKLVTLYELMADVGWKRALVTTTEITHATPAGFAACTPSRGDAEEIAAQYLERKVDLIMGGGRKYFTADRRKDKRDLLANFQAAGYAVLQTPADLKNAPSDKPLAGIFASGHLPYNVDRLGGLTKVEDTPSLAAMTKAALRHLHSSPNFILQVEGGRVDHACHSTDAAGAMHEMISFDEAVDVCLEYQKENPEVLLVLTTDHGNGNPALNGMGGGYQDSPKLLRNIAKFRQSIGEIGSQLKAAKDADAMVAVLEKTAGYKPSRRKMEALRPFFHDKGYALYSSHQSESAALSQVLANHTGISFTSGAHTSDLVPVLAHGPGAEAFRGLINGPDIFFRYTEFAGVNYRNPQEELDYRAQLPVVENTAEYLLA